jgi:hypothetical protein
MPPNIPPPCSTVMISYIAPSTGIKLSPSSPFSSLIESILLPSEVVAADDNEADDSFFMEDDEKDDSLIIIAEYNGQCQYLQIKNAL